MAAVPAEKNITEKREKRAKSIAAMGLVNREGDRFQVLTPSLRWKQTSYEVWRDEENKIRCSCLEFEEAVVEDSGFRCEHILAVKYALLAKNTESAAKQPVQVNTEIEVVSKDKSASESRPSERGEQETETVQAEVSANGQAEIEEAKPERLANTKGEPKMKQAKVKEMPFVTAQEIAEEPAEGANNVLEFKTKLQALSKNVDPNLVKRREGWRDRNGNVHMVDYVEWHTVADILD